MDIEKELAELNQMPEDEQLKRKIQSVIIAQKAPKKRGNVWKEIAMIVAICSVAFLLLVTGTPQTNQATSNEIQHIYTYFDGKENQFRARTSTLYIGVQEIKNDTITTFFKHIETMEKMGKGYLDDYIVDVIVVKNNESHRYQMSSVSLYDVDNGIYYKGNGALFDEAFRLLYKAEFNSYIIILPLGVITINLLAGAYYKRRKIKVENPVGNNWGYMVLILACLAGVCAYSVFVGPLYKPFLIVLAILYGYIILKIIRRHSKTFIIVKIESYKAYALTILLIIFIFTL